MLWLSVTLLALFASVQGRAVNISNTWVLPEEGFPVFYRYFRDRISWYEADAVCQFHHANLVTVDTTAQYDAVRAYLKELDISSAVWVGLIRSNPDGDFTWTDYRGLSGDGYWSSAPDTRAAPLCAAADPAADYRWEARACGGPTVASFICELPVPQWALGKEGCMVRALPALTALYLPESAAVQLTADCGLAGVKRVQCSGNVKREELLKDLSCNDEDDPSSTISVTSTSNIWPATETTFNDQETSTDDVSTAGNVVTEESTINSTPAPKTETPFPYTLHTETEIPTSTKVNLNIHNYIRIPLNKDIYLEQIHSNDIPQPEHQENTVYNHHLTTIEENKSYHHRLLHDEMTRRGNLETIFTQPTDHFVPPLVMAKARISDDMTVLSLEEKHAQQIAEHRFYKHNKLVDHVSITPLDTSTNSILSSTLNPTILLIKDQESTEAPTLNTSTKKDLKSSMPKKYIDKYSTLKAKSWKTTDNKIQKTSKIDVASTTQTLSLKKEIEAARSKLQTEFQSSSEEDPRIDLTVIINEPGVGNGQQIFYSNHTNTLLGSEQVTNLTDATTNQPDVKSTTAETILTTNSVTAEEKSHGTSSVTLNHEVIKITVVNDNRNSESSSPVVFEVSTLTPFFQNNSAEVMPNSTATVSNNTTSSTIKNYSVSYTTISPISSSSTQTQQLDLEDDENSSSVLTSSNNIVINNETVISTTQSLVTTHETPTEAANLATTTLMGNVKVTENVTATVYTTAAATIKEVSTTEKLLFNHTDNFEEEHDHEDHNTEMIDDYQSPLLSAANEPLHRPNRSRRPLPPPNRINKFNPFRILG